MTEKINEYKFKRRSLSFYILKSWLYLKVPNHDVRINQCDITHCNILQRVAVRCCALYYLASQKVATFPFPTASLQRSRSGPPHEEAAVAPKRALLAGHVGALSLSAWPPTSRTRRPSGARPGSQRQSSPRRRLSVTHGPRFRRRRRQRRQPVQFGRRPLQAGKEVSWCGRTRWRGLKKV